MNENILDAITRLGIKNYITTKSVDIKNKTAIVSFDSKRFNKDLKNSVMVGDLCD
jgi:hypothetical protein